MSHGPQGRAYYGRIPGQGRQISRAEGRAHGECASDRDGGGRGGQHRRRPRARARRRHTSSARRRPHRLRASRRSRSPPARWPIIAMYSAVTPQEHAAVMRWAFFPAGVVWATATMWMVAFYTGVRPMRWLLAVSAGFCGVLVLDLVLPFGLLQRELGAITSTSMAGADVSVVSAPSPHPLNVVAEAVLLAAFALMFSMAWRIYRRGERRQAWIITAVLMLFFAASVVDALQAYGVLSGLYFTQLSFVALVFAVSVGLRQESLKVEAELRDYRTHLESVVDERVRELDEANAKLGLEVQERLATEESLRRRVAELERAAARLADARRTRSRALDAALDQATARDRRRCFSARPRPDRPRPGRRGLVDRPDRAAQRRYPPVWITHSAVPLAGPRRRRCGALVVARKPAARSPREERQLAETVAGARRRDRDRPPAPPDQAGGRGGAPGAGARPARRGDAEHLQRHPDRRGAAGRVGARPGRGAPATSSACGGSCAPPWRRCARCCSSSGRPRSSRRRWTRCSSPSATRSAGRSRSPSTSGRRRRRPAPGRQDRLLPRDAGGVQQHRQARARARVGATCSPTTTGTSALIVQTTAGVRPRHCRAATWACAS